jgi:hypothetical protein
VGQGDIKGQFNHPLPAVVRGTETQRKSLTRGASMLSACYGETTISGRPRAFGGGKTQVREAQAVLLKQSLRCFGSSTPFCIGRSLCLSASSEAGGEKSRLIRAFGGVYLCAKRRQGDGNRISTVPVTAHSLSVIHFSVPLCLTARRPARRVVKYYPCSSSHDTSGFSDLNIRPIRSCISRKLMALSGF